MYNDEENTMPEAGDNSAPEIKPIGKKIVHRICSGQVIVTLATAIKELVENSIDAKATNVDIHLVEYGSIEIQVTDNGIGVDESNFEALTLKHYTSKLNEFEDLNSIETFGFRGEALSSLCALANLSITTKTQNSKTAYHIEYNGNGKIISKTQCARGIGTTIVLKNIFQPLPVRHKEFLKNLKKEFYKMVNFLYGYCLVCKGVRITCANQERKCEAFKQILSVPPLDSVKERIISIFGSKQVGSLVEISSDTIPTEIPEQIMQEYGLVQSIFDNKTFDLEGYVSRPHEGRSSSDRQFFFINARPFESSKISKIMNDVYHTFSSRNQYPFVFLNIKTQQDNVDVNVSPDKRSIFLQNEKLLYSTIKATLFSLFSSTNSQLFKNSDDNSSIEFTNDSSSVESHTHTPPSTGRSILNQFRSKTSLPLAARPSVTTDFSNKSLFAPQFSGIPEKSSKIAARSILSKFRFGAQSTGPDVTAADKKSNEESKQRFLYGSDFSSSPKNSGLTRISAKQPKLFDFISSSQSHRKKPEHTEVVNVDSDCEEIQEVSEESSQGGTIESFSHSQSQNSLSLSSSDYFGNGSIYMNNSETEQELDSQRSRSPSLSPVISLSQRSTSSGYNSIARHNNEHFFVEEGLEENPIILYDDELSDANMEISDSDSKQYCHSEIKIQYSLDSLRQKLLQIEATKMEVKEVTDRARRFRAKLLPSDNKAAENELRKEMKQEMFSEMEILGQFNLGFIIAKHESDLFIIDQHASDEKYNFETLEKNLILQNQKLISPMTLQLPAVSENILIDNLDCFKKNGFDFEINENGEPTTRIKLTSIPFSKQYEFGREDVEELIFMLEDAPEKSFCRPTKVRTMLASRACRKSIMIGDSLGTKEMNEIVQHMGKLHQPWNCPHGRPTIRHLFNLNLIPDDYCNAEFNH